MSMVDERETGFVFLYKLDILLQLLYIVIKCSAAIFYEISQILM